MIYTDQQTATAVKWTVSQPGVVEEEEDEYGLTVTMEFDGQTDQDEQQADQCSSVNHGLSQALSSDQTNNNKDTLEKEANPTHMLVITPIENSGDEDEQENGPCQIVPWTSDVEINRDTEACPSRQSSDSSELGTPHKVQYMQNLYLSPSHPGSDSGLQIVSTVSLADQGSDMSPYSPSSMSSGVGEGKLIAGIRSWTTLQWPSTLDDSETDTASQCSQSSTKAKRKKGLRGPRGPNMGFRDGRNSKIIAKEEGPYAEKRTSILEEILRSIGVEDLDVSTFCGPWGASLEDLDPSKMVVYRAGNTCPVPTCECPTKFQYVHSMEKHFQARHVPEWKRCVCKLCGSVQVNGGDMKRHLRNVHHVGDVGEHGKEVATKYAEYRLVKTKTFDDPEGVWVAFKANKYKNEKDTNIKSEDLEDVKPVISFASDPSNHSDGSEKKGYVCRRCGKTYKSWIGLCSHPCVPVDDLDEPDGDRHTCDICGKVFDKLRAMRVHQGVHVRAKKIAEAEMSQGKGAANKKEDNDDKRGDNENNSDSQQCRCALCGKTFAKPNELETHMKYHKPTRVSLQTCPLCKAENAFGQHELPKEGSTSRQCKYCGTEIQLNAPKVILVKAANTKQWISKPDMFKTQRTAKVAEKPYKCGECGRSFICCDLLALHMRNHTGEVHIYKCDKCDKEFSLKTLLDSHKTSHENPISPSPSQVEVSKPYVHYHSSFPITGRGKYTICTLPQFLPHHRSR